MRAGVHAVVREKKKRALSMAVWDVFHVLLARTFAGFSEGGCARHGSRISS